MGEVRANFAGGANTPFWLVSNLQGLGSPELNNGWARGRLTKGIDPKEKISWGAGIDLVGGWNITAPFNIHQLYGEFKYRRFYVLGGSKEIWGEYNNHYLSSGNLLYSGNAMPIPQIRIGTYGFAPFWGTKEWFSVKTYLAYGKFTDSKWIKSWITPGSNYPSGVLYCSKGLWLRGGNNDIFPLTADVGIEMATQFGGIIHRNGASIKMPQKFIDWLKAIFPFKGGEETPWTEQTNIQGNMLGAYNISIAWRPKSDWWVKGYFEHYFEDQSQMTFEYGWRDWQWGIEAKLPENKFVSKIVYEYVYTKYQTGPVNHDMTPQIPEQVSGGDNYFNHHLYGGWQHWGMGIGTPLAISPIYNIDHNLLFLDTRFIANHFGLEGNPLSCLKWRLLMTFTQNWGTYRRPLPNVLDNVSGLVEIDCHPASLKGWFAKAALAWDSGLLLGNNFGAMITIGKEGFIPLKK